MVKALVLLFAQAVLIQCAFSQCAGRAGYGAPAFATSYAAPCGASIAPAFSPMAAGPCSSVIPAIDITPTSGGALPVASASPVAPDTLIINSENSYGGTLAVVGDLPFVGTVGVEGVMPTVGSGAVNHACGGPARMSSVNSGYSTPAAVAANGPYPGNGLNAAALAGANLGAGYFGAGLPEPGFGLGGFAGNPGLRVPGAYPAAGAYGAYGAYGESLAPYGGSGEGNVAVAGELPVAGEAVVVGQVPIMGAVEFVGPVPAYGSVSITGFCSCGCDTPYL